MMVNDEKFPTECIIKATPMGIDRAGFMAATVIAFCSRYPGLLVVIKWAGA